MSEQIWIGADNSVNITGLRNASTGLYINDATCTFTLLNASNTALITNRQIPYVANSNGNYRGLIDDVISSQLGREQTFTLKVTAISGPGYKGYWEVQCCAHVRDENG